MRRPERNAAGPICILGLPRSGTTWLAKIFDSHPDTLYRHEPDSGGGLGDVPLLPPPDLDGAAGERLRAFLAEIPERRSLKTAGKLPLFPKGHLRGWRGAMCRGSIYAGKALSGYLRLPVIEPLDRRYPPRLVWKSIESTGRAGAIARAEPATRVIHLIRHPAGQIDSTLRGESGRQFSPADVAAEDWHLFQLLVATPQARRLGLDLAHLRSLTPAERLAWRWVLFNTKAMEELADVPHGLTVRYEDLCQDPEGTVRSLFDFTGLPWDGAVSAFLRASTRTRDDGYYSVYRDPASAAEGWRERLSAEVVARIDAITEGTLPGARYGEAPGVTPAQEVER